MCWEEWLRGAIPLPTRDETERQACQCVLATCSKDDSVDGCVWLLYAALQGLFLPKNKWRRQW